jgi:hypothetical protein
MIEAYWENGRSKQCVIATVPELFRFSAMSHRASLPIRADSVATGNDSLDAYEP